MDETNAIDRRELRQTLGAFVTGVTIVTTVDARGRFHGLTANSFSSVSLDPPLVLWSQSSSAPSHAVFSEAPRFAINILAEDQLELSNRFARSAPSKFAGLEVDAGLDGVPLIRGCSAQLECRVVSKLPGGDHTIYVGEVLAMRRSSRRPLVFGGGQYLVADPHDLGTPPHGIGTDAQSQLRAVRLGTRAMARLARETDETLTLAVWGNHGPTILAWEPSSSPISGSLPPGLVLPVTSTATGQALASHLPDEATSRFVNAELGDPLDEQRLAFETWSTEMQLVRGRGLARRQPGAFHGGGVVINAISAPVLDASGCAVLAITGIGDATRFDASFDSPFADALRSTAVDLSHRLGYSDYPQREATSPHAAAKTGRA